MRILSILIFLTVLPMIMGCQSTDATHAHVQVFAKDGLEAEWIRNGEPIEFENEMWYPVDGVEGFVDSEMRFMGEYRNVPFFTDKVDVRPYGRLYTKFDKNKFRFFEKKIDR